MLDNMHIPFQRSKREVSASKMLSEIDLKILWVSRTLTNIDFRRDSELLRVEESGLCDADKRALKAALEAEYERRRQPYVKLLNELQEQQRRQSFAA